MADHRVDQCPSIAGTGPRRRPAAIRGSVVMLSLLTIASWADLAGILDAAVRLPEGTLAAGRIDPSRATVVEWQLVPGIGPATAARIVRHRATHGSADLLVRDGGAERWDLGRVPGVGPITVRRIAADLAHPSMVASE